MFKCRESYHIQCLFMLNLYANLIIMKPIVNNIGVYIVIDESFFFQQNNRLERRKKQRNDRVNSFTNYHTQSIVNDRVKVVFGHCYNLRFIRSVDLVPWGCVTFAAPDNSESGFCGCRNSERCFVYNDWLVILVMAAIRVSRTSIP